MNSMNKPMYKLHGFTLIEIMIVVAIMGILSAIAIPGYQSYIKKANRADAGRILAERVIHFMRVLAMPRGLTEIGYNSSDIPTLVEGTLAQQRLLKLSPRPTGADELALLFDESLAIW